MKHNKLVRDNIPEIIEHKGEHGVFHVAEDQEYRKKLKEKLTEEVEEFLEGHSLEELADILEIIEALAQDLNVSWSELMDIKEKKARERGSFTKRIILEES